MHSNTTPSHLFFGACGAHLAAAQSRLFVVNTAEELYSSVWELFTKFHRELRLVWSLVDAPNLGHRAEFQTLFPGLAAFL